MSTTTSSRIRLAGLVSLVLSAALFSSSQAQEGAAALRVRAVGDVMLGTDYPDTTYLPPADGAEMLTGVQGWLQDADLTFINLEGPLCDGGETEKCAPGSNCYAFRTPTRYGAYLREAGVDLASTANNHAADFEAECRDQTHAVLDSLGIAWSGPPGTVASVEAEGLRVALVAFHSSDTGNQLNDLPTADSLVRAQAARHDVVIVSFHGGAEGRAALHVPDTMEVYYGEQRGHLRRFTRQMVDAGADLVIGHGPHVPRAMEVYRDRLIAYSLGNFATYGRFSLGGELGLAPVLEAQLDREGRFVAGRILSAHQVGEGVPRPDPMRRAERLVRRLSLADFPRSAVLVLEGGWLAPPARALRLTPHAPAAPDVIPPRTLRLPAFASG